ncbi:MAG: ribonuclease P protein component [Syntrophorhabdaceae bacterium]|nr:ribonuclease P protein component [Syntrophorhabdaceae bacterium]
MSRPSLDRGFPPEERLRADKEFVEVVRKGERAGTVIFKVYRAARGGERRQVGISAGKRAGKSVVRNRMKRLLREFYRLNKEAFPLGTRTVVVVRKAPENPVLDAVSAELLPALAGRWGTWNKA